MPKHHIYTDGAAEETARRIAANKRLHSKHYQEHPLGMLRCVECKITYDALDVVCRGWKRIGEHSCLCGHCNN